MDSSHSSLDSDSLDSSVDEAMAQDATPTRATQPASVTELEIRNLEAELKENPSGATAWQKQLQLVALLRAIGDVRGARTIRQAMSETYPLSEKLWLAWIEDERRKAETDEEQDYVTRLFARACDDYLSVPLWLQRCDWAYEVLLERHESPTRVQYDAVRTLYESAISSGCGLHYKLGHEVWQAFIAFERRLIVACDANSRASGVEERKKEEAEQLARVRTLYKRMLSVPLEKLEEQFADYEKWETEVTAMNANAKQTGANSKTPQCPFLPQYKVALKKAHSLAAFESKLSDTYDGVSEVDYAQFSAWTEYIAVEQAEWASGKAGAGGSAARVRCLYERAIKNYFLVYDLWRDYLAFLEKVNAGPSHVSAVFPILERALRNSPCAALWVRYMGLQELSGALVLEVAAVFNRALAGENTGVQSEEDFRAIIETFLDIRVRDYKRSIAEKDEDLSTTSAQDYRDLAQWCIAYLQGYEALSFALYRHWALVETYCFSDATKALEIYEKLLTAHSKESVLWDEAITCCMHLNAGEKARQLFRRVGQALQANSNCHYEIAGLYTRWTQFERLFGTPDTIRACNERVQTFQQGLQAIEAQYEAARLAQEQQQAEAAGKKPQQKSAPLPRKRKVSSGNAQLLQDRILKAPKLDKDGEHDKKLKGTAQNNRGDLPSAEAIDAEGSLPEFKKPSLPARKPNNTNDANLNTNAASSTASASQAASPIETKPIEAMEDGGSMDVETNATSLTSEGNEGRSATDSPQGEGEKKEVGKDAEGTRAPRYKDESGLTVFVTNIPFKLTQEEFASHVREAQLEPKEVRLQIDRNNGKSKGFAYIEFNTVEERDKCIQELNGKKFNNMKLKVEISNPPSAKKRGPAAKPNPYLAHTQNRGHYRR